MENTVSQPVNLPVPPHNLPNIFTDPDSVIHPVKYATSFPVRANEQQERLHEVQERLLSLSAKTDHFLHSVWLSISLSTINVYDSSELKLLMTHSLRRISYATCCPQSCQFAFLAREPQRHSTTQFCHVFLTSSPLEAEDLKSVVADAFKLAFAKQQSKDASSSGTSSPVPAFGDFIRQRKNALLPNVQTSQEDPVSLKRMPENGIEEDMPPSNGLVVPRELSCDKLSVPSARSSCVIGEDDSGVGTSSLPLLPLSSSIPVPPPRRTKKSNNPYSCRSSLMTTVSSQPESLEEEDEELLPPPPEFRNYCRIPSTTCKNLPQPLISVISECEGEIPQAQPRRRIATSVNTPNKKSPNVSVVLESSSWYRPHISRESALEYLDGEKTGTFVVRDSNTHPGWYALSVQAPHVNEGPGIRSRVCHFLIQRTQSGVKLKGLDKEWPSLESMIIHLSVLPEILPCPLSIPRETYESNPNFQDMERVHSLPQQRLSIQPQDASIPHPHSTSHEQDYLKLSEFSISASRLYRASMG